MKYFKILKIMLLTIPLVLALLAVKPSNSLAGEEPYVGEIIMFAGNFAPRNWAFCNGQLLHIVDNTTLFSILGTFYGGDGVTTFALPDLRGRVAIHNGQGPGLSNRNLGEKAGTESQTLTVNQMPVHNHLMMVHPTEATNSLPAEGYLGKTGDGAPDFYHSEGAPTGQLATDAIHNTGGNQPISIMQPYNTVNFIIALEGIYPSRP